MILLMICYVFGTRASVTNWGLGGRIYRKTFNIRRTKPQSLNDSRLVLQLSLSNPLEAGVKSRMKM